MALGIQDPAMRKDANDATAILKGRNNRAFRAND